MKLGNACTVSKKTLTAAAAPSAAKISSPVASKAPKSQIQTPICKMATLSADKLAAKSLSRAIEHQHSEGYEMVIGLDEAGEAVIYKYSPLTHTNRTGSFGRPCGRSSMLYSS